MILIFWSGALLGNICALPFLPWRHRPGVRRKARVWLRRLVLFARGLMDTTGALQFDLDGTENLAGLKGTVVVANHPSLMDAVFLLGLVPDSVCIFKKSIQRNVALSSLVNLCGFIANDTGPGLVREAVSTLSEGCNLIIFPEGTRSVGGLNEFRPGFALISILSQCPVQTVHMSYDPPLLAKNVPLKDLPRWRPMIRIRPGPRLDPSPGTKARDFAREVVEIYENP